MAVPLLERIKRNQRAISDALAGAPRYFSFLTTSLALYRELAALAPRALRGRTLDAGSGRQAYRALLEKFAEKVETLDIEPFAGRTDHVGDIREMPLPNGGFDAVFCAQTLHHVSAPQEALNEMARVLKPGGMLLLSAPHLSWLHNEPHDYFRFTVHGLREMLRAAGLEEVETRTAGGLLCFLGFIPTTAAMGLLWGARPLFWLLWPLNALWVRLCLAADRWFGARRLYPVNYVVLARKPEEGPA